MRDLRRLKRLTQLKTRLRDAVRANLVNADHALQEAQTEEAEVARVYDEAIDETTRQGETPAHVLLGRAERATRGRRDVNDAGEVVAQRMDARENAQSDLRDAHREVKAMELLTARERSARHLKRDQAEQAVTEEVTASKQARKP